MTARRDPLIGTVLNDRYRIDAKIARGGMAMVYRGTDLRLDREIAIKVMHEHLISDDTFVERFRREAINAGRLTHPNLVAIHDQARDGDIVYLVMEYLPSVTLRRELKHRGTFTPRQAIVVLDAILAALEAVHSTGIIHRDLKPDNVLLGTDGQVKLADFGLARAVTTATTTKTLIGTVGYVAPELVTRAGADARTDLYTVGIMFYEMLTGAQPYTDEVPIQVAYRHVHDTVPPPSDVVARLSPRLDALVLWATSKDPEDRPADAAEFRLALAEARAEMSEAELDLGDPQIAAGEHSPVLTASIDLGEEVPKEKRSRTDEIPYLEGEEDDTEDAAADGADTDDDVDDAADPDDVDDKDDAAGAATIAASGAGVAGAGAAAVAASGAKDDSTAASASDDSADADESNDSSGEEDSDDEQESKDSESDRHDKAAVVAGSAAASAGASPAKRRRRRVLTGLVAVVAVRSVFGPVVLAVAVLAVVPLCGIVGGLGVLGLGGVVLGLELLELAASRLKGLVELGLGHAARVERIAPTAVRKNKAGDSAHVCLDHLAAPLEHGVRLGRPCTDDVGAESLDIGLDADKRDAAEFPGGHTDGGEMFPSPDYARRQSHFRLRISLRE